MGNIKWLQVENPEQGAEQVYQIVKQELEHNRLHVLGLATGSTMIPVYKRWTESDLDFSDVKTFNLDEYVGLEASSPNSYAYFMKDNLFNKKQFKETNIPNGMASDLEEECKRYEEALQQSGLDIQLLGVGENGHIAFNEPGTGADSVTHVAQLTESTLGVNSQYFENDEKIPETALTMGISSIMSAKNLLLLAFGEKKRAALEKLQEGKVTAEWPITYLHNHGNVTIITDLKL
ncbi:glucosamine-6-phosphate deaminase [Sporosarcina sp. NCCP-2222]|uniref:glucosamine-6-phosphate deaminase n=1 Tax=Sporosarcina sp. NCCP-2222 TaxID=2935073 RepID=UPI002089027E|nr:glucosamine-6-phosphate deaminase [Sporosarcina sp. NCCP-2222]GKV56750.1 glucosamine-6-phosphate deaminase [Sporosarcina sp. NCCP-2222]